MDWNLAIEHRRVPLLGIVLEQFAEMGLTEGGTVERVSKPVYRYALRLLRKAELAVRRLIYVAARNIVIEPEEVRPAKPRQKAPTKQNVDGEAKAEARPKRKRRPLFKLFDPLKRFKNLFGRRHKRKRVPPPFQIVDVGSYPLVPLFLVFRPQEPPPAPRAPAVEEKAAVDDGMVDATNLIRRFIALMDALHDIPRHAMRLARWRAPPVEERHPPRWSPLRSGRPPGFRERAKHEIDEILKDCDWLARNSEPPLDDTS